MQNLELLFKINRQSRSKRPRGVMRRAQRILRKAERFHRQLGPDDWFHYCHWHQDWRGIGNRSRALRLITLQAHLRVFEALATSAPDMGQPFQLFLSLDLEDAGQDAVFMHTPNPHSAFPAVFGEAPWGVPELESLLQALLPSHRFVACRQETNYLAYAVEVGLPLSPSPKPPEDPHAR